MKAAVLKRAALFALLMFVALLGFGAAASYAFGTEPVGLRLAVPAALLTGICVAVVEHRAGR